MDTDRWERLQALFHAALERPAPERRAFVEAEAAEDPALAADVLALLEADAAEASPLDGGVAGLAREVLGASAPAVPRRVGPYEIERVLGRGGMGVVYLAERADLRQRVALKVLRDASLSPMRRERFRREEQTLAQLTHPNIARLYDADALPDGTPYFVMEYVEGVPLTNYCAARACSLRERLRLFRDVCEAVQHAHRHAVVHRDLKPSNIFVTEEERTHPQVKLLDFGIAKQLEGLDTPAEQTLTGLRLMTPAYAAPEQLRGEAVGVYTDVYALGVLLYELLAGRHPYDLAEKTPGQAERLILETEPAKPSAARRTDGEAPPLSVRKSAWADLDVLCLTAMHKDPQRRYATVEALVRDLDRFLKGKPLEARPDALGYRVGKFLRRHRQPVAAAALVAALIIGLVIFYTVRLASARDAAVAEAARVQRIQSFMLGLFTGNDEVAGPPDTLRVLTLLDRGAQEAGVLDGTPAVQAELHRTLGTVYREMGFFAQADSLLTAALGQQRALFGPEHPEMAQTTTALSLLRNEEGRLEEAERLAREALAKSRRHLPLNHPDVTAALYALGYVRQRQGAYNEAISLLTGAAQLQAPRGPSPSFSQTLGKLANAHFFAGHYATSDSLNRLLLRLDAGLYGKRHPSYATRLINLAATQKELGYPEEAERLYRQALAINQSYHGRDHHVTASNLSLLGGALADQGEHEAATAILREALAVREKVFGKEHIKVALTLNKLGHIAFARDDLDAADSLYARQLAIYHAALDDGHQWIATGYSNMASVYSERGELERAEETLREALTRYTEALSPEHLSTGIVQVKLGRVLLRQGRHAEAEAALRRGYEIVAPKVNPASKWHRQACKDLVAVYKAQGRPEEAARFRTALAEATVE